MSIFEKTMTMMVLITFLGLTAHCSVSQMSNNRKVIDNQIELKKALDRVELERARCFDK